MIKELEAISSDVKEITNIINLLLSEKNEAVQESYNYLTKNCGKMIRPSLVVISGMLCGYKNNNDIHKLAAVIELLHIASLVHDDVIDEAKMRRGVKTISYLNGNKHAVIIGDIIISESFKLLCSLKKIDIAIEVVNCASQLSEGEIIQEKLSGNIDLTLEQYLEVISKKTSSLFAVSMKLPFIFFDQDYKNAESLGNIIGTVFQLIDDVLDYESSSKAMGKNKYNDFYESKITLPIILLKNKVSQDIYQKLKEIFIKAVKNENDLNYINILIEEHNIINDCYDYINKNYIILAKNKIMEFNKGEASEILTKMADFIFERNY